MLTRDITKAIQKDVGVTADGIYGRSTALAIIKKLNLSEKELTKL